jgi:hypothetical protein
MSNLNDAIAAQIPMKTPVEEFVLSEYLEGLTVNKNDDVLTDWKKLSDGILMVCDDAYIARSVFWGLATALENNANYVGSRLLPQAEQRLNSIEGRGFKSEADVTKTWFANEDAPHVNDDVPIDQQIDNQKAMIEQRADKLRRAAIGYAVAVRHHDSISADLDQLSYAQIKQRSNTKRLLNAPRR